MFSLPAVVDCGPPELYLPTGARARFLTPDNSTTFGSSFIFECESSHYLAGGPLNSAVSCLSSGLWDFGALECICELKMFLDVLQIFKLNRYGNIDTSGNQLQ